MQQSSSETNSFILGSKNSGNTTNIHNTKVPKIPPLNLPQNNNENAGTLTRSTRRADPFKSFSTNSNRFSNSIDSGFKDQQQLANLGHRHVPAQSSLPKSINENNYSLRDGDNSYFFEDKDEKSNKNASPLQKMAQIAQTLGEYNLTIDLGCLLA